MKYAAVHTITLFAIILREASPTPSVEEVEEVQLDCSDFRASVNLKSVLITTPSPTLITILLQRGTQLIFICLAAFTLTLLPAPSSAGIGSAVRHLAMRAGAPATFKQGVNIGGRRGAVHLGTVSSSRFASPGSPR